LREISDELIIALELCDLPCEERVQAIYESKVAECGEDDRRCLRKAEKKKARQLSKCLDTLVL